MNTTRQDSHFLVLVLHTIAAGLLLILLSGCGPQRRGIHQVGNWGPVTFYEDGKRVTFYTAQISEYHGPLLYHAGSQGSYSAVFTETPASGTMKGYDDEMARHLFNWAPEWRREEKLVAVAARLTIDEPKHDERFLISSHNPVVIAVSDGRNPLSTFGRPYPGMEYAHFFIPAGTNSDRALQNLPAVRRLIICPEWPSPDASSGKVPSAWSMSMPGMRVEEVLRQRPWESRTPQNERD